MSGGWDANGMEREPYGEHGNVRNPEWEVDGPAAYQRPITVAELVGSDPGFTGDMSAEEYVRSLRDS